MQSLVARFAAFLLSLIPSVLLATSEPPDFSNSAPGDEFLLNVGANTFSGTVTTPGDAQDYFRVTVPAGMRITQVSKTVTGGGFSGFINFNGEARGGTGSAIFTGAGATPYPLPTGTYQAFATADVAAGAAWSLTITVAVSLDYTVTTGSTIVVTDVFGRDDALAVTQPGGGLVKFAAPGRFFSVNGGTPTAGDSGNVALSGVASIVVNAGAGHDSVTVGAFAGTSNPGLTINGGTGDDTVHLTGDITFASGNGLDVDLQNDHASPGVDRVNVSAGANLIATGSGAIRVKCSRSVTLAVGASLETANGPLVVEANQQATPTAGDFAGVSLSGTGALLRTSTFGGVTVAGRGGDGASGSQCGVKVENGAKIVGASSPGVGGEVNVSGTGGASAGSANVGVSVTGVGSAITAGANVNVLGNAGPAGSGAGVGVSIAGGAAISSTSLGFVSIIGTGAGAAGSGSNHGVAVSGSGSGIVSAAVTATAGPGAPSGANGSWGFHMTDSAGAFGGIIGGIAITADTAHLDQTVSIESSLSSVSFTATGAMDLGGADGAGILGLTDAELDRIAAPHLNFGVAGTGEINITAPLTRDALTDMQFLSGTVIARAAGTDVHLAGGKLTVATTVGMPITGAAADTGFPQWNVAGGVQINLVPLDLTGTTYAGSLGESFTILENDGTEAIGASFINAPEGGKLPWPGASHLLARITYVGGDGNDIVLTLVSSLEVTNTADAGAGSLRAVIADAAARPGADLITFHPAFTAPVRIGSSASSLDIDANFIPGYCLSAGTDRALIVVAAHESETDITGVTFSGLPLTPVAEHTNGNRVASIWVRAMGSAPVETVGNIVVSRGGVAEGLQGIFALAYSNVDQLTPMNGVQSRHLESGDSTVTVASEPGDLVLDILDAVHGATPVGPASGFGQLNLYGVTGGTDTGYLTYSVSSKAGASSVPMAWTSNASSVIHVAANLNRSPVGTVVLASEIILDDASGPLTVDARGMPGGVIVDGGPGAHRIFSVAPGTTLNLIGLTLTRGNGAGESLSSNGGAIFNGGTLSLTDCILNGNVVPSGGSGGGIFCTGGSSSLTATRCVFTGNSAGAGSLGGGAIFADAGSTLLCMDCTFTGNTSRTTAGAIHAMGAASATVKRCAFTNNNAITAGARAGAVSATSAHFLLEQCTLSGNTAVVDGGAASCAGSSTMTLRHCTVSGNSAASGGGVALAGGTFIVDNSIVADNAATTSAPDLSRTSGTLTRAGRNIVGDNSTVTGAFPAGAPNANGDFVGTTASPINALLAPLGDYGGLTHTLALLPGSPARNNSSGSAVTGDQRGFPLVGAADIGAYEAGTITNYTQWSWETLPAAASAADRDPGFDLDRDERSNALEFATHTDGGEPSATVLISPVLNAASTQATFTIPYRFDIAGLRYFVERSTALLTWTPIAAIDSGINTVTFLAPGVYLVDPLPASVTIIDTTISGEPQVFHRLRIEIGP